MVQVHLFINLEIIKWITLNALYKPKSIKTIRIYSISQKVPRSEWIAMKLARWPVGSEQWTCTYSYNTVTTTTTIRHTWRYMYQGCEWNQFRQLNQCVHCRYNEVNAHQQFHWTKQTKRNQNNKIIKKEKKGNSNKFFIHWLKKK